MQTQAPTLADFPAPSPKAPLPVTRYALDAPAISRVIEMAWEDRTPFEAIAQQFGLNESAVIALMRANLKRASYQMWRKRVTARATKHAALRDPAVTRHQARHSRQV